MRCVFSRWMFLLVVVSACGAKTSENRRESEPSVADDVAADDTAPVGDDVPMNDTGSPGSFGDDTADDAPADDTAADDVAGPEPAVHRANAVACDDERPTSPAIPDNFDPAECRKDADCTDGRNGRCLTARSGPFCSYDACLTDADCGAGGVCACGFGERPNRCALGDCRVDKDCGKGGFCSPSLGDCGNFGGIAGYWCHTSKDECIDDRDCADAETGAAGYCAFSREGGKWACSYGSCVGY